MPLITVKLIEGVFSDGQKKQMASTLTEAMIAIEGETMRSVTWVVIEEVKSRHWAMPIDGPSPRILSQAGFVKAGSVMHPEDGEVWRWALGDKTQSPAA